MATLPNFTQILTPLIEHKRPLSHQLHSTSPDKGFPILAIAVLAVSAAAFLVVSYYIFTTKCNRRRDRLNDDQLDPYSASLQGREIDERLILEIPIFQYMGGEKGSSSLLKCVVCLNEFLEYDFLRILPNCNHAFHLGCIDAWLQSNSNCPLCRSSISESTLPRPHITEEHQQHSLRSEDYVIIEASGDQERDRSHSSVMQEQKILKCKVSVLGDEVICARKRDECLSVVPIRRCLSMDSAIDTLSFQSIKDFTPHHLSQATDEGSSSRRIFSFGHGRG